MTEHDDDDDAPQDEDDGDPQEDDAQEEAQQRAANSVQTPARAPDPVPAAAVGVGRRPEPTKPRGPRRKKDDKKDDRERPRRDPDKPEEADLCWAWVIEKCTERNVDPAYVTIRIARVDVGRETTEGYLQGSAVLGDDYQTPGEALIEAIIENFHLNSGARGPVLYNVVFNIKGDRGFSYRSQLKLPAPDAILKRRQHAWYPGGYGAPPGGYVPPPPRGYSQREEPRRDGPRGYGRDRDRDDRDDDRRPRGFGAPPAPGYPYPGYPPFPYPGRRHDPDIDSVREEMRELKHMFREVLMGRGASGQPVQQGPDWAALNSYVQSLEKTFGVKLTVQAPGLGAIPQQQPAQPPKPVDAEAQDFEKKLTRKLREGIEKEVEKHLSSIFNPKEKEEEAEEDELPPEDKPEADFEVVEVPGGVTYPGTDTPIRYARDRETGDIHWFGSLASNPDIAMKWGERIFDTLGKFADIAKAGLGGRPPQISSGRETGGGSGGGGLNGSGGGQSPPTSSHQTPYPSPPSEEEDDDGFGV